MNVSLAYLEQCSAETGHAPAMLEKVTRMGELAGGIARHPLLGNALALKGGTALNLCHGTAPVRLSVDLDYNCVAFAEREIMLAERPGIERAIVTLAQRLGFRVQQSADTFAGRKIYAMYPSALGVESRVEIDLNYLWRAPLAGVIRSELWQPGSLDRPSVQCVSRLELCVGKFLAFLDRSAPRDAYDLGVLSEIAGDALQTPLFRGLFMALSATLPHPLPTYRRALFEARLSDGVIQEQLVPVLSASDVPARDKLIKDAWSVIAPFLELAPEEQEYINQIHNGTIRAGLLFPNNPELSSRIAIHPAILWKVMNVIQERNRHGGR